MDLGIIEGLLTQVSLSTPITAAVLLSVGISIGKFYTKQDLRQMPFKQALFSKRIDRDRPFAGFSVKIAAKSAPAPNDTSH